jgi:dimethylhistidine N-methyltransferase
LFIPFTEAKSFAMTAATISNLPYAALTPVGAEVYRGLTRSPKTLSPWLLYDAAGSRLFEEICGLPEYYLTRTERKLFARYGEEMVCLAAGGRRLSLLELGAGTAAKTGLLLQAAVNHQGSALYYAIDVSETALTEAKIRLESEIPSLTVKPVVADYTSGFEKIAPRHGGEERRLVLYIGSSIGNFDPHEAEALLAKVRASLAPGDGLLLGVDMVKDPHLLLAAYDDAAGVTAEFNWNVLRRINRELDANFHPQLFRHHAIWNPRLSRIEMHLESQINQRVRIGALDLEIPFSPGETIHTENSYKFSDRSAREMLLRAGFTVRKRWTDARSWFGVYLAAAA